MKFVGGVFAVAFLYWTAALLLNQLAWKRETKSNAKDPKGEEDHLVEKSSLEESSCATG